MATTPPELSSPSRPDPLHFIFFNPCGLRAGWRLLIFVVLFVALSYLVIFPVTAISRRLFHGSPFSPGVQMLGESVTFVVLLIATWIMSRIEQRPMGVYGLSLKDHRVFRSFVIGYVFWGFLALSVCLLALHLLRAFDFGGPVLHGAEIISWGTRWFLVFVLVGLSEEYLLRGYALCTLADGIGFWPASIVLGLLFGLGHASNPGETRIGLAAAAVFALFASLTLRLTGNLWLAVGAHAGWDWGQSYFYGVSDSGFVAPGHLLAPTFRDRPAWLTGGTVGPEGSIVTLLLWILMIVTFALIFRKRSRPGPILVIDQPETP